MYSQKHAIYHTSCLVTSLIDFFLARRQPHFLCVGPPLSLKVNLTILHPHINLNTSTLANRGIIPHHICNHFVKRAWLTSIENLKVKRVFFDESLQVSCFELVGTFTYLMVEELIYNVEFALDIF